MQIKPEIKSKEIKFFSASVTRGKPLVCLCCTNYGLMQEGNLEWICCIKNYTVV